MKLLIVVAVMFFCGLYARKYPATVMLLAYITGAYAMSPL